jgi:hypothetical protein
MALPFLPSTDETLDLKTGSFRSTKTGRFTRKFPLKEFVNSLTKLLSTTEENKSVTAELVKTALILEDKIKALFIPRQAMQEQAVQEAESIDKESLIVQEKQKLKKTGFDILKFAAVLPLLFNDKIKAIVTGFFHGFLDSISLAMPALKALRFITRNLLDILKVYFGIKLFKRLYDAFVSIKKLAELTGILSQIKQGSEPSLDKPRAIAPGNEIDLEKEKLKKRNEKLKRRLKRKGIQYNKSVKLSQVLKKNIKNIKNIKNVLKSNITNLKGKITLLKDYGTKTFTKVKELVQFKNIAIKFKQLVFGGLKNLLKVVRVIKTGLALTGIGYLLGGAVDAGINTLIDYFTNEDPKKAGEGTAEKLVKMFANNFIKSITFGFFDLNTVKRLIIQGVNNLKSKNIIPEWVANKIIDFIGKPEEKTTEKPNATTTQPTAATPEPTTPQQPAAATPKSATPQQPSTGTESAESLDSTASSKSAAGAAVNSTAMESSSLSGETALNGSQDIEIEKKIISRPGNQITINNLKNNTIIPSEKPRNRNSSVVFSDSVGF